MSVLQWIRIEELKNITREKPNQQVIIVRGSFFFQNHLKPGLKQEKERNI